MEATVDQARHAAATESTSISTQTPLRTRARRCVDGAMQRFYYAEAHRVSRVAFALEYSNGECRKKVTVLSAAELRLGISA